MRVYILSNANLKKNILSKLEPYFHKERQICYIWSLGGLLQVENDKIYNVKIQDVLTKKTLLGAFPVTIDESEFLRKEECFQIAPRSYKEYTILKSYRLPKKIGLDIGNEPDTGLGSDALPLEWILEYKDNELHDNYFSLPAGEDIHSSKNKADLLQFLNL
jgi:hypothetical protein